MVLFGTANAPQENFVRRVLSTRPFVFIGKISYSFYLWHWPVLVFGLYYLMDNEDVWVRLALVFASALLSFASYYFVEQPIRKDRRISRKTIFGTTALTSLFFIAAGLSLYAYNGAPFRFNAQIQSLTDTTKGLVEDGHRVRAEGVQVLIGMKNPAVPVSYLVWGDSHANSLAPAMDTLGKSQKTSGYLYKKAGCFPSGNQDVPSKPDCKEVGGSVFETIQNTPSIKTVVLVARWSAYPRWWSPEKSAAGREKGYSLFEEALDKNVRNLRKLGKKVVIVVEPPPLKRGDVSSVLARNLYFDRNIDVSASFSDYLEQSQRLRAIIEKVAPARSASIVRLYEPLCKNGQCDFLHDGRSLYYDSDHLSTYGANHLVPFLKKKIRLNP